MTIAIGFGLGITSAQKVNALVLDQITATASVSYSVRKTRTAYAGPCLRVRESVGNTEMDIPFGAGGWMDTVVLLSFVGAGDGFVTVWYDQSGNALNLTKPIAAAQPKIVASGVLLTKNSKPFMGFYGVVLGQTNALALASPITTVGTANAVICEDVAGDGFFLGSSSVFNWHNGAPTTMFGTPASTSIKSGQGFYNGVSTNPILIPWPTSLAVITMLPLTPGTGTAWDNIGQDRNVHHTTNGGGWSELIQFSTALSTIDRQTLERNQGSAFGVSVS